jgi:hypothetical protein
MKAALGIGETDERHHDADGKQRRSRCASQLLCYAVERGGSRDSIDQTQSEKGECTRGAAKEKIFQPRFGRTKICFVECGHDIKRKAEQLEPDEDHE